MNKFKQMLSDFFRQEESPYPVPPQEAPVPQAKHFVVRLDDLDVGHLRYGNGQWSFEYTDGFREHVEPGDIKRVIGFPQLDRLYTSPVLWPFFQIRLPGKYINAELGREVGDVELLERYGQRSVLNPYEVAVQP